ncbi:CLUMA_CG005499, isoform A [Clunio marinus]|uniref:CLUMA_CG005499, isoform A n=1 Tax=Clunio marinus TaxID=568069 RepID=A0A1J1HZA5_9DIPT|nr:CLUMA_CG005499, isoform A [Clunio marinus]
MNLNIDKKRNDYASLSSKLNSTKNLDFTTYYKNIRSDASLVPPIRQTASIFKQPVTVVKTQEGKVKSELKHGSQEKPKQLFWEKRLENFHACDSEGTEFTLIDLPKQLKPVGPHVKDQTLFQSVATALHSSMHPVTGQMSAKTALSNNPGVFVNPDQPLLYACSITEDDIRKQEDRVQLARKKLQEALAN